MSKAEDKLFPIEEIYFLPQHYVYSVQPDPEAICIGIRNHLRIPTLYNDGFLAVRYICQGIPSEITDPEEQRNYRHPDEKAHLARDELYQAKQMANGVLSFLKKYGPQAKRLYVNCEMGESRSYAVAMAVATTLELEAKPFENHTRSEDAWTNGRLRDLIEYGLYKHGRYGK